jgi:hypothetical protein
VVDYSGRSGGIGAVGAAEHPISDFYSVTDDAAGTVSAGGCHRRNCTFKTVESVALAADDYIKAFVVLVSANLAGRHTGSSVVQASMLEVRCPSLGESCSIKRIEQKS